jgi:putative membrane protein
MEKCNQNNRRDFLIRSLKGAAVIGAGATFAGSLFNPMAALAQTGQSALQAKVATLGTASLQTSQLALTKASNPQVKMFARFEAAEQETMGKILKDMGTPVPAPSAEGQALLTKLQSLSGAAFDKAFMQGQVETHQKLHAAVTALNKAGNDPHVKHVTSLALTTIIEHTERGQLLLNQLGFFLGASV